MNTPSTPVRWYQLPIAWLGVALFAASLAGCIAIIWLGEKYSDEPLPDSGETVFKVPATRTPEDRS